jgi:hypothetical protein
VVVVVKGKDTEVVVVGVAVDEEKKRNFIFGKKIAVNRGVREVLNSSRRELGIEMRASEKK